MIDSQSNAALSGSQQSLPSFENVLAFPQQRVDESWPEYVGRVQLWDRERTEKAQASGAYRAVPYISGLDPVARGLFVSLAWHSFSEGLGQYAPIRLSERSLAALMGDTSSYAKGRAGAVMRSLIAAGAVEVLEEARGSRPRLVRVAAIECPSKERHSNVSKGTKPRAHNKREEGREERAAESSAPPDTELAQRVHDRFPNDITRSEALALISQYGEDVVRRQLQWFGYRDISKFRKGAAAAFCCFCRDNDPEPVSVARARAEVERTNKWLEEAEAARARSSAPTGRPRNTPTWLKDFAIEGGAS